MVDQSATNGRRTVDESVEERLSLLRQPASESLDRTHTSERRLDARPVEVRLDALKLARNAERRLLNLVRERVGILVNRNDDTVPDRVCTWADAA